MLKSLVVGWPDENLRRQFFSGETVEQKFIAVRLKMLLLQNAREELHPHGNSFAHLAAHHTRAKGEWRPVALVAGQCSRLRKRSITPTKNFWGFFSIYTCEKNFPVWRCCSLEMYKLLNYSQIGKIERSQISNLTWNCNKFMIIKRSVR